MRRLILVEDELNKVRLERLFSNYPEVKVVQHGWEEYMNPEDPKYIFKQTDLAVVMCGRAIYDEMVQQDRTRVIHLGLRSYNYPEVCVLEVLTVNKVRIFVINHEPEQLSQYRDKLYRFLTFDPEKEKKFEIETKIFATCDDGIEKLSAFDSSGPLGFDFESYGVPEEDDFEPVGIGISNRTTAIYVDFRYAKDDATREAFIKYFGEWVDKHYKQLICYYAALEVNALKLMYHKFYPLNDAMALVRCDERMGSLKLNAQNYLHVKAWDTEQDDLMDAFDYIFPQAETWNKVIAKYEELTKKPEKNEEELTLFNSIAKILEYKIDPKMYDRYWGGFFAVTPTEITGLYCMYDAYYTLHLFNEINKRYHYVGTQNAEVCEVF